MCGGKETIMPSLHDFIGLLEGCFDNREQFEDKKKQGTQFPYAKHINTVCNGRIADLPQDFAGVFLLEESYYTSNGKTHASPHLFLFTEENGAVTLTSYQMPEGYTNDTFTAGKIEKLNGMIREYAESRHILYIDYHSALKNDKGGMLEEYSSDGVHPNKDCYKIMERIVLEAL